MEKKYLTLNDLKAYTDAFQLSNEVWDIVAAWKYFAKDTVGKQCVRAVDSISANIAEGFGRYTKKDKMHFYRYSYGSITESLDWVEKSKRRKLLTDAQYESIMQKLNVLPREVHHLIKFTNENLTI